MFFTLVNKYYLELIAHCKLYIFLIQKNLEMDQYLNEKITTNVFIKRVLFTSYINIDCFNKNLINKIYSLNGNKIKNKFVQLTRLDNLIT